jgi:hypothetical protein
MCWSKLIIFTGIMGITIFEYIYIYIYILYIYIYKFFFPELLAKKIVHLGFLWLSLGVR